MSPRLFHPLRLKIQAFIFISTPLKFYFYIKENDMGMGDDINTTEARIMANVLLRGKVDPKLQVDTRDELSI